jgi:hypothetical protein
MRNLLPAHHASAGAGLERQHQGKSAWNRSPERKAYLNKIDALYEQQPIWIGNERAVVVETNRQTLTVRARFVEGSRTGQVMSYHVRSVRAREE